MKKRDRIVIPSHHLFDGPVWLMQPIPYFGEKLRGKWIVEPKIDGWRMQIIRYNDGRIEFWGRRLEKRPNWTKRLSWLVKPSEKIPLGTLLDCELSAKEGRRFIPSLFAKPIRAKPIVQLFDVIFYKNHFVGRFSLNQRKAIIARLNIKPPFYLVKYKPLKDLKTQLVESIKNGYEGIVIKRLNSPYQLAKDGPIATEHWRKIKRG